MNYEQITEVISVLLYDFSYNTLQLKCSFPTKIFLVYITNSWKESCNNDKFNKLKSTRNSYTKCSVKKVFLRISQNSTGKHLCWRLQHKCFSVNFEKFLRTPFLLNTSGGCFWSTQGYKMGALARNRFMIKFTSDILF